MNRKIVTAKLALSAVLAISALAQAQSSTGKPPGLTNPGFEDPRVKEGTFVLVEKLPGWKTTDTRFEIWGTGFKEVPAHEGTQFVELNAYINGTLYQDSTGIQRGSPLDFTFAHRGRSGEDTMKLTITDLGADNSLGGGDDTVLFTKQYTTGNNAWVVYNSTTEQKIKALGSTVRFAYGAISTATGELGEGNLLDAANFGVGVVSTQQAPKETPIVSVSAGEVHIKTPDGLAYDFQGTGEFLCSQSDDKKAIVQSRQEPWPGNPTLSINTAAAISADGNKFEFYLKPKFRWFVNDEEQPAPGANGGGSSAYPGGTRLNYTVLGAGLVEYIIYWSDNSFATRVMVTESAKISYMDIGIRRDSAAHTYQGMFGNIDKNPKNDMTLRNGEIVTPPASITDLNRFTDSWRLTTEESLFGDAQRDQKKEALAKSSHTEVQIPKDKWDAAETEVKGAGITSPIVVRNATYDIALTGEKSFIESAKVNDAAVQSLPPAERTLVAGDAANKVAVDAENKAVATLIASAGAAPTPSSKGIALTFEWSGEVGNDASVPLTPGGEAFGNSGWMLNGNALPAKTVLKFTYTIPDTAKDTDGTPGAGRYTGGTLNVSIPSLGVNSTPAKAYDLVFGTDGSSDFVLAQPSDNTGFALVSNWPATADPWPNPNVLSPIANPKAINIIGTSPDGKFTLILQSGHELRTSSTELLANPVFSSSSAKSTPVPATVNALVLAPGSAMNVKQKYWSENKEFYAIFQPDGNFGVSTKNDGYKWDIVTKKKTPLYAKKLVLNPTGNLVFLGENDKVIWSIDKLIAPVANSTLNISNSGDLLLIGPDGAVLWDSSK